LFPSVNVPEVTEVERYTDTKILPKYIELQPATKGINIDRLIVAHLE
jgi:hypothetical protein